MGTWFRSNWFRLIVAVAVVLVAVALFYYLVRPASSSQESLPLALVEQQQCAEQAVKAYAAEGFGPQDIASYVDHYDQKLNKCFIEIYDRTGTLSTIYLIDAYELKEWDSYLYFYGPQGNNGGQNPVCNLDEQIPDIAARAPDCTSQAGFDAHVSPFMTD